MTFANGSNELQEVKAGSNTVDVTEINCEPAWCIYPNCIYLLTVFCTGLVGNLVVQRVMFTVRNKSSTDVYVTFLSASDLLTILTNIPLHLVIDFKLWLTVGSNIGCKIHFFLYVFTFTSSGMYFALIGIDRYLKIFKSFNNSILHKHPVIVAYLALLLSCVTAFLRALLSGNNENGRCRFNVNDSPLSYVHTFINGIIYMLTSAIICIAYFRIVLRMRRVVYPVSDPLEKHDTNSVGQHTSTNLRNFKVLSSSRALAVMSILFLGFTILPTVLAAILSASSVYYTETGTLVTFVLSRLYYVNVCINPYIYFKMNSEFRERAKGFIFIRIVNSFAPTSKQ